MYFWGLLWPWKLTFSEQWMNFLSNFVSLMNYLSYIFYYMALFSPLIKRKRGKNQFFNYFWRMLLKFEEKKLEIHKCSRPLITWILKKLNSIQTLSQWYLLSKTYKKSHSKIRTLVVLNKFFYYPNDCLIRLRILSYWELTVVDPISSLIYLKFHVLSPGFR